MPSSPPVTESPVDPQRPWLGLSSFTEETRQFFYGRDDEVAELARRVQRKLLTVLFGQSGLGKTSILRAGLVPKLRPEGFCPIYVRLDHSPGGMSAAEQIKQAVIRASADLGAWSQPDAARDGESLWEFFHHRDNVLTAPDGRVLTPLLIFDQFEEIFTLAQTDDAGRARAQSFLREFADLIENRAPTAIEDDEEAALRFDFARADYRVLIALREDYLAHLERLRDLMPSITQNRVGLSRMAGGPALEAILRPGAGLVNDDVARQIVRFVSGASDLTTAEVEPSLLSLVCRELNEMRLAKGEPVISADLLAGSRDSILGEFYERSLVDQPIGVRHFIEDVLLTDSGFRESVAEERVQKAFAEAGAPDAATQLVDRRLLRIEERLDVRRVELTHDVLCGIVRASRDSRREREATERAERELAATRAREAATARALWRARMIAAGCAVLAVAAIGSAVFGYVSMRQARAAEARAQHTQELADTARTQAEGLVSYMLQDLAPSLEQYGRVALLTGLTDQAVHYFDALPSELKGPTSLANGADALSWAGYMKSTAGDPAGWREFNQASIAAWERAVAAAPDDPRAALGLAFERFSAGQDDALPQSEQEKQQRAAVAELRRLHQRHPDNRDITRTLAQCLTGFGFKVGWVWGHNEEQVAAGEEAIALLDGLLATEPKNPILLASYTSALRVRADGTQFVGDQPRALAYSEAALAFAEKALLSDPGNLALIAAAAQCGNTVSFRASNSNQERSLEAERGARAHWQTLAQLDPNNASYRREFVKSHMMEAYYWWNSGKLGPTQQFLETFDALLESLPRNRETDGSMVEFTARRAILAAETGDADRARELIAVLRERSQARLNLLPEADLGGATVGGWFLEARVLMSLHDWVASGRIADELAARVDTFLRGHPDDIGALFLRIHAGSLSGRARLRTGKTTEAAATLEPLLTMAERVPPGWTSFESRQNLVDRISTDLAEAWIANGEPARARELLEKLLPAIEAEIATLPGVWATQRDLAAASFLLARTFDPAKPAEAARRRELLDRAAAILAAGETNGQLTNDDKELKAGVTALRAER